MDARDEILSRLRHRGQQVALPPPWTSRRSYDDLAEAFTTALTAVSGEIIRTPDLRAAVAALDALLSDLGAGPVVANGEPPLDGLDLAAQLPAYDWLDLGQEQVGMDALRDFCATAVAGISGAEAALAETGSVVINSGLRQSRQATLLPPVHIALLPAARLTTDIFTWTAARQGDIPANVTLVSGPSKTADIEQTMAIGVHGPKRFIVLLYDAV